MPSFTEKDNVALQFDANKIRLRTEGRIALNAVMNLAIGEMTRQFNAALSRGEILEIAGTPTEMKRLLLESATEVLTDGSSVEN